MDIKSKKPPRGDDTLRAIMNDSADKLKQIQAIIERGRITKSQRAVRPAGPWAIGLLYFTEAFEIRMCVAASANENPPPFFQYLCKAVYIGLKGKASLYVGSGYMRLAPGTVAHVNMHEEHVLEPLEDNTQVLLILIGENREETHAEDSRGSSMP